MHRLLIPGLAQVSAFRLVFSALCATSVHDSGLLQAVSTQRLQCVQPELETLRKITRRRRLCWRQRPIEFVRESGGFVVFFFWPFTALGLAALLAETLLTFSVLVMLTIHQLASREISMDFKAHLWDNFGYNLFYLFTVVLIIPVYIVVLVVSAVLSTPLGLEADQQMTGMISIVATIHLAALISRSDKINVDWPEETE